MAQEPGIGVIEAEDQTILAVHESAPWLEESQAALRGHGYAIVPVATTAAAIAAIESRPVQAALIDIGLEGGGGIELCRKIRSLGQPGSLPIILLSARGEARRRLEGYAAGADDFLERPFWPEELCVRLDRHIRERSQRRALEQAYGRLSHLEQTLRERTDTLERQIRFTSQIIDSLPVSLYVVDRARRIVAWNRQRELGNLGLQRQQVIGRSVFEVFDQQKREAIEAELTPAFDRGESLMFERDSTAEGGLRHFRVRKLPMRLEPGEVTHVLTIGEDITEQRRMQKSMVVAEKMAAMGRLASGVAHEINNPLATIVTCADGLRSRLTELPAGSSVSPAFREYLDIVEQEAYRAKRITEDLLDFSRVRPSARRVQSLERILDRTLLILKHHAGFRKIEVARRFESALPPIAVEEDAIVQVFVALIINALDAMPDGGSLTLTTCATDGEVRCEIRDTGCGIDPADLPHIFEPFFTTKPPGRGTGLGLAVCYGIMQAHGGRIEVDSSPTQGSRFTVVIPAAQENSPEKEGIAHAIG
jgi:PAS domain S-box-containing protein